MPQLGTTLTHAHHYPAVQMAPHLYGRLMHVTIKIALQINVKSAAFVLVLMEIAEEHRNQLVLNVTMVIIPPKMTCAICQETVSEHPSVKA